MQVEQRTAEVEEAQAKQGDGAVVVVLCRRGNKSQVAADVLRKRGVHGVFDLTGGLHAWADTIDPKMPKL